jgi:putative transposase
MASYFKRKSHSARFKAKVALEAYKGDKTAAELISAHKISSGQVSTWKKCGFFMPSNK